MGAQIIADLWERRIERRCAQAAVARRLQLLEWLARYQPIEHEQNLPAGAAPTPSEPPPPAARTSAGRPYLRLVR